MIDESKVPKIQRYEHFKVIINATFGSCQLNTSLQVGY